MSSSVFSPDPTATLLIRLWMGAEEPQLRARIIEIRAGTQITVETAAGESGIRAAVVRWLSEWTAGQPAGP